MDYGKHFKERMTQAEIDSALMAKMEADQREIARLRDVVKRVAGLHLGPAGYCSLPLGDLRDMAQEALREEK